MNKPKGRPKSKEPKLPVTFVRLTQNEKDILEILARNSHVSIYKYVDRLIHDRLDEYLDNVNNRDDDYYEEPEYWIDEDGMYHEGRNPDDDVWEDYKY